VTSERVDSSSDHDLRAMARVRTPAKVQGSIGAAARVLIIAVVVRALFIAVLPLDALSGDLSLNWTRVAALLNAGKNPYAASTYLNWPPLWMQILYALQRLSVVTTLPWLRTVQLFTALLDVLGLAAAFAMFARAKPRVVRALQYGWALNPSAILFSCQHCNFDGLVALFCVLGVGFLIAYERTRLLLDWLYACLFVGLGILAKTVPIVLVALLGGVARPLDRKTRVLGVALTFGPVALGLSVIYVLTPKAVTANVLHYRSYAGWYGISGLLAIFGHSTPRAYTVGFEIALTLALAWIAVSIWTRRLAGSQLVLAAAGLLLFIPTFGPGYGPQYIAWSLPFLAIAPTLCSTLRARIVIAQMVVTALTSIVEYGLFPSHGAAWLELSDSTWLSELSAQAFTQTGQTLVRLPLFIASTTCLIALAFELRHKLGLRRPSGCPVPSPI
jgi:hypothetical protein